MHFILIDVILEIVPHTFIYFSLLYIQTISQQHDLYQLIYLSSFLDVALVALSFESGQQAEIDTTTLSAFLPS